MNPFSFFKTILYINLDHRVDRLIQVHKEMDRVGIKHPIRIPGVLMENRVLGFNQAQRNALEACVGDSLILEDDVVFKDEGHLLQALDELPEDWDLLYLGCNCVGTDLCDWPVPSYYSPHLRRVKQAWTTHAVAYSDKCVKWLLQNWDHTNGQIFDDVLRCNLERLEAFIICPMIADQRKGISDIWQREIDYGFFNKWEK